MNRKIKSLNFLKRVITLDYSIQKLNLIAIILFVILIILMVIPNLLPFRLKKPAIYLYPLERSRINVSLSVNGFLTQSEPDYSHGWSIIAEPTGLIDGQYDYLFYEAHLNKIELPSEGWVVRACDLEKWFDTYLYQLGLNDKEASQFKEYWLEELPVSRYYEIRLFDNDFLTANMNLIIDPKPDTIIRLNFYFKPIDEKTDLIKPKIETPTREGFTVVEWGGVLGK